MRFFSGLFAQRQTVTAAELLKIDREHMLECACSTTDFVRT